MSSELPAEVAAYLEANHVLSLATAAADGTPHATTLTYAHDDRAFYVWMRPERLGVRPGAPRDAVTGAPLLTGCAAHLDCLLHPTREAGDHLSFIGEVRTLGRDPGARPRGEQRSGHVSPAAAACWRGGSPAARRAALRPAGSGRP